MVQYQQTWPVAVLCAVLGVSRSGFYTYGGRQVAFRGASDEMAWCARGRAIHVEIGQSDGSRRMATPRQDEGMAVGRDTARRLMKEAGVTVRRPKQRPLVTTDSQQAYPVAPHLVARQFDVEPPEHVWVGDMT
jgi:putative transposase